MEDLSGLPHPWEEQDIHVIILNSIIRKFEKTYERFFLIPLYITIKLYFTFT